jgi:hypothetical protein
MRQAGWKLQIVKRRQRASLGLLVSSSAASPGLARNRRLSKDYEYRVQTVRTDYRCGCHEAYAQSDGAVGRLGFTRIVDRSPHFVGFVGFAGGLSIATTTAGVELALL